MNNNIAYNGIVTASLGDNVYEFKNQGTERLGAVLCEALCGYSIKDKTPDLFDIEYKSGESWISLLKERLPFVAKKIEFDNNILSKLSLSATIQYEYKYTNINLDDSTEVRFCIYNNNGSLLAFTHTVTDSEVTANKAYQDIQPGTTMFLQWDMIFSN